MEAACVIPTRALRRPRPEGARNTPQTFTQSQGEGDRGEGMKGGGNFRLKGGVTLG